MAAKAKSESDVQEVAQVLKQVNDDFKALKKEHKSLKKEMKASKEFKIDPLEQSDAFEPVDINLLEKLRKKYNL